MSLIYCYGDTKMEDAFAKNAAEIMTFAYPNHCWWVECKQGVLVIKHMEASGLRCQIGMLRKMDQLSTDAKRLKQQILDAAGEMLERANMPRGARTADPVNGFELDDKKMSKHWHRPLHIPRFH